MIPMRALGILLAALALHAMAAEPVGVSEDIAVPEALSTDRESTGTVFPDTKEGLDAIVDEVLVEVEAETIHTNEKRNNKLSSERPVKNDALAKSDVLVQESASGEEAEGEPSAHALLEPLELNEGGEGGEGETAITKWSKIPAKNLWALAAVVTFLIAFTLIFEHGKEHVVEEVKGTPNEPLIMSIFSELTVLGFLALVCFLVSKMGIHHLSLIVFGHADVEEDKQKLSEMIEGIHMVIFLVMILFVMEALGMMYVTSWDAKRWEKMEETSITLGDRKKLIEEWVDLNDNHYPGDWEKYFGVTAKAKAYIEKRNHVRFMLMRQEFINDEMNDHNKLARDFNFTLYLRLVMGERLAHAVELPMSQWIMLEIVTLIMVSSTVWLADGEWIFLLCIWIAFAHILVIMAWFLERNQWWILHQMVHTCHGRSTLESEEMKAHDEIHSQVSPQPPVEPGSEPILGEPDTGEAASSLKGAPTGTGSGVEADEFSPLTDTDKEGLQVQVSSTRKWINSVPRYLVDENLDDNMYGCLPSLPGCGSGPFWCRGDRAFCKSTGLSETSALQATTDETAVERRRFFNLFPYGKQEVSHQLFLMRFFFLGNAVYLSVYIMCLLPMYVDDAYSTGMVAVLTVVGLLPGMTIYFRFMYQIIGLSTQVTGVEHFRNRRHIDVVKRTQKEQRCVSMLRMLVAIKNEQDEEKPSFVPPSSHNKDIASLLLKNNKNDSLSKRSIADSIANHTNLKLDYLAEMFDSLDKNNDGDITKDEINVVMAKFGVELTDKTFREMATADGDSPSADQENLEKDAQTIDKTEFIMFLISHAEAAAYVQEHDITNFVFDKWDVGEGEGPGNGTLTVQELMDGLTGLGEAFSASDISNIVNELDVNDDGEFSRHEFTRWIEIHDGMKQKLEEAEGSACSMDKCCMSLFSC